MVGKLLMQFATCEGEFSLQDAEDNILMQIPVKWLLFLSGQITASICIASKRLLLLVYFHLSPGVYIMSPSVHNDEFRSGVKEDINRISAGRQRLEGAGLKEDLPEDFRPENFTRRCIWL